jgi:hypothetical protein
MRPELDLASALGASADDIVGQIQLAREPRAHQDDCVVAHGFTRE